MSENEKVLTPKQAQTITALLTERSTAAAARQAGVSVATLYRWFDDPSFCKALTNAEGLAIDTAARSLVGMAEKALEAVAGVLNDPAAHPATRLRAAEVVLGNLLKMVELRNIERRLAALEKESSNDE